MSKRSLINPPLDELVLGIQFNGRIFSSNDIFTIYQNHFQKDYPEIQEQQLLPNRIELADRSEVRVLQGRESRKQFVNKSDDKVIQFQPDRILFNWRRGKNKSHYPHYEEVFAMFENEILDNPVIKDVLPHTEQWELTYLDQIVDDSFRRNEYNIDSIFNWFNTMKASRSFQHNQSYYNSDLNSGVNISINTATRNSDKTPLVLFETTVRGMKKGMPIRDWFFSSREIIVQIFYDAIKKEKLAQWNKPQK